LILEVFEQDNALPPGFSSTKVENIFMNADRVLQIYEYCMLRGNKKEVKLCSFTFTLVL